MTSDVKNIDPYLDFLRKLLDESADLLILNFPQFQATTLEALETIFATKAVAKQLALAIVLETGIITANQILHVLSSLLSNFSSQSRLIRHLKRKQVFEATTQDEWMDLAERIDSIQGNDVWRSDPNCQLYEGDRIASRIDEFVHLMRRRDTFELMFVLRGGIGRNKFGLLHEGLFSKAMAGSKVLVETYHNVVCAALDTVCDVPTEPGETPIPTETRLQFFNEVRHQYGRTALLLSGGATLGFYHFGVVKALMDNRLMPRVLGGASAGSIVCAMVGTRTDEECQLELFDMKATHAPGHSGELAFNLLRPYYFHVKNAPPDTTSRNSANSFIPMTLRRLCSFAYGILTFKIRPYEFLMSDTEHLRECVRKNIGDFTFQEAFDRTGRILNITVTPNNSSDPSRLLNYLTAPHVLVWSAAAASSSLPGVFESNRLLVKDADGTIRYESGEADHFSDGSMEQDLPMQQLSEMFNVNHFIISQANPHAAMFASYYHVRNVWSSPVSWLFNGVLSFLKARCRSWVANFVSLVGSLRIAPKQATSRGIASHIFVQEYEGRDCDISLIPWINHRSLVSAIIHALYNPDHDEIREWTKAAERETWKHIPAIKSHIAEEITLDRCVQRLRKRVVAESGARVEQRVSSKGTQKLGLQGVPSFFTSSSIGSFGGIANQANIDTQACFKQKQVVDVGATSGTTSLITHLSRGFPGLDQGSGSSGDIPKRLPSATSGIFIDDEEPSLVEQLAREQSILSYFHTPDNSISAAANKKSEVSTTSGTMCMTDFYYRKSESHGNLVATSTRSGDQLSITSDGCSSEQESYQQAKCRKSKSHSDLPSSCFKMNPYWGFVELL